MEESFRAVSSGTDAPSEGTTIEDLYALLSKERRRHLLRILRRLDTEADLDTLTRNIAVRMDKSGGTELTRLRARLHHCDVPKLDDADIVSYQDDHRVELTSEGQAIANLLQ